MALQDADLIFLDPDNGFEVPSMSRRTEPKYAFYEEAADYLRAGKTVIAIQFARQCDPVVRGREIRERLTGLIGGSAALPILRGRVAPNILFFTMAPVAQSRALVQALERFAAQNAKVELIP